MTSDEAPSPPAGQGRVLARAIFALYLAVAGILAWRAPVWEWDLLAYLGCVEELRGAEPRAAHAAVYEQLAQHAPAESLEALRGKNEYRAQLADDAAAFAAQLPFYRGRILYVGLLSGLSQLGLSAVRAAYLVSLLAGLAFATLLFLWCARHLPPLTAAMAAIAGLELAGARGVLAMATPDALAAALLLSGAYCLVELAHWKTALVLWILAVATRADHVLLLAPLVVWLAWLPHGPQRLERGRAAISLGALAATFYFCTAGRDTYSWWTVFQHTFFRYKLFPAAETPPLDLAAAAEYVLRSLPKFKGLQPLAFGLLGLVTLVIGLRRSGRGSRAAGLAGVALLATLVHFALLPVLWPRLMLAYWSLAWVAACVLWSESGSSARREPGEARAS